MSDENNEGSRKRKASGKRQQKDATTNVATTTTTRATTTTTTISTTDCPYLDTVQRSLLDFDLEPSCSVTMEASPHVYGCLVCGKFFRGRGKQTPAYTHSVEDGHFLFVHLWNGTFHCLPDDYQVQDPSLLDIQEALHPSFNAREIQRLDSNTSLQRDLFGRRYLPGFVGLNNLHKTDYVNAVVQGLVHVKPLRDFFLRMSHTQVVASTTTTNNNNNKKKKKKTSKPPHRFSPLVLAFGELVRKLWSGKRFKSHVDPHQLIQTISTASQKRFQVGQQAEAGEFMAWFLNQLHIGLGGKPNKPGSSIIHQVFQGKVKVTTRQKKQMRDPNADQDVDDRGGSDVDEEMEDANDDEDNDDDNNNKAASLFEVEETTNEVRFVQLTLDIPEKPLFRDDEGGLVIPQEPLVNVLKKFDGITFSDALSKSGQAQRKRYQLLELPPYLILHLARFTTDVYSRKKNPTIVAFPVKNFDLSPYVMNENNNNKPPTEEEVRSMSVSELKSVLQTHGRLDLASNVIEKSELMDRVVDFCTKSLPDLLMQKYNLVANITHDSPADVGREGKVDPLQEGSYKCHVQHEASHQWYEIQDLHVKETMPQLIGVSESYLLIFERKTTRPTDKIIMEK